MAAKAGAERMGLALRGAFGRYNRGIGAIA